MISVNELFQTDIYPEIILEDVMDDSRHQVKNSIFFSLQGLTHDGHAFINQAISNGAIVIVHTRELKNKKDGILYIHDPKLNENYATLVNRFYDDPSSKLKLIGVTGTNGKTTTAILVNHILEPDIKAGYMGSLGVFYDDLVLDSALTTNTLVGNLKHLNDMVEAGVKICAMETSSQGIDMGRIEGLQFESSIFTNLTQDHLDYHLNMESYYQAKKKLFKQIDYTKKAVINIDDLYGARLAKEIVNPVISISSQDASADVYISNIEVDMDHSRFSLTIDEDVYNYQTNLLGRYNIFNLVQAMVVSHIHGIEYEDMIEKVKNIPDIGGRMQVVNSEFGFKVIIDFAHSPDSMEKILEFTQSTLDIKGRIISIFGSAGKRDKSKRKIMGEVADQYSDLIYLTEDDPRDEKVSDICMEIASGIFSNPYIIVESRIMAIHLAIQSATKDDIIVIMGKGNENTMAIGYQVIAHPTDYEIVKDALEELRKDTYEQNESIH